MRSLLHPHHAIDLDGRGGGTPPLVRLASHSGGHAGGGAGGGGGRGGDPRASQSGGASFFGAYPLSTGGPAASVTTPPGITPSPPTPSGRKPAAPADSPYREGMMIHGYRLIERLGAGGFGEVWRAENLDRESFALKFGREDLAADTRAALRREIDVFLRLRSDTALGGLRPPVVALKNDLLDSDPPILVMEYLAGGDLRAWMRDRANRRLSFGESLPIIRDALAALDFAHARGVVHRDLSPENILLDREARRWKVTDFGVGGFLAETELSFLRSGASHQLSREVVGKIDYMAPEMRRGEGATPATDIYSLGVVWVQLLTGRMRGGLPATWMRHAPDESLSILERCLEDDLHERWSSAREMSAAIDEVVIEQGIDEAGMRAAAAIGGGGAGLGSGSHQAVAAAVFYPSPSREAAYGRRPNIARRIVGAIRNLNGTARGALATGCIAALTVIIVIASVISMRNSKDRAAAELAAMMNQKQALEQELAALKWDGTPNGAPNGAPRLLASATDSRVNGVSGTTERAEPKPVDPAVAPPIPPMPEPSTNPAGPPGGRPPGGDVPPVSLASLTIPDGQQGSELDIRTETSATTRSLSTRPGPPPFAGGFGSSSFNPVERLASLTSYRGLREKVVQSEEVLRAGIESLDELISQPGLAAQLLEANREGDFLFQVVQPVLRVRSGESSRTMQGALDMAGSALNNLDLDRLLERGQYAIVHSTAAMMEMGLVAGMQPADSVEWYQRAAQAGHSPSLVRMGEIYYRGLLGEEVDTERARQHFERAAHAGDVDGMYNLAIMLEESARAIGTEPTEAMDWYQSAADEGSERAMWAMVDLSDGMEAKLEWIRRLHVEGDANATAELARAYRDGDGLEQDVSRAISLYQLAAKRDNAGAMNDLAALLLEGEGGESDPQEALRLMQRAAQLGNEEAAENLARLRALLERDK